MVWKTSNGGLQYLKENKVIVDSHGYDFSKYYARLLSNDDLLIPRNIGSEWKLKKLKDKLSHGFYHVNITCENTEFRKIFTFSKHNVYLNNLTICSIFSLEISLM